MKVLNADKKQHEIAKKINKCVVFAKNINEKPIV